jgi:hypothetical protein
MMIADSAPHSRFFTTNPIAGRALAAELHRNSPARDFAGLRLPCTDLGQVPGPDRAGGPEPVAAGIVSTVSVTP